MKRLRTFLLALALVLPSLARADCVQSASTGVIDCGGATGYPLGNSDNAYVPGTGIEPIQPQTYQQFDTPSYLRPQTFDNPQQ